MKPITTFDDLLDELGAFGKYQILFLLFLIPSMLFNAWTFFDLVFMLYKPEHHCAIWNLGGVEFNSTTLPSMNFTIGLELSGNSTSDECDYDGIRANDSAELRCTEWTYDRRNFERTVLTEWDSICESQAPLSRHIMLIFTIASVFGLATMSLIQDRFGRKVAFFISWTANLVGGLSSLAAPSLGAFVALRAVQQTQTLTLYNVPFLWAMEFVGPAKRTLVNFLVVLFYTAGTVSVGMLAYFCRTWTQLGLITTVPFVAAYGLWWFLDESPRWLLSMGRVDEAMAIIEKIARRNGKSSALASIRPQIKLIGEESIRERDQESTAGLSSIFRAHHLRLKVILLTFVWIANSAVYSMVAFNAAKLANMYTAYTIQAAVEAPACLFNLVLSNRIGRLPLIIVSMLFSAMFSAMCIPAYVLLWGEWYVAIFAALTKFGVCISWNVLYQATGEMYPTAFRATGGAISTVIADGTIGVMPYILSTSATDEWLPMGILSAMTLVGALCSCLLPETMDTPMPQTVDEAERVSKVELGNVRVHLRNLVKPCLRKKVRDSGGVKE